MYEGMGVGMPTGGRADATEASIAPEIAVRRFMEAAVRDWMMFRSEIWEKEWKEKLRFQMAI